MPPYSYSYAIPYVIVFFILSYLYVKERKGNKSAPKVAFFILLLFIGLRGHVYSDYVSYYPFFEELPTVFELDFEKLYVGGYEFGFVFYSSIIKTLFPNYFCWVFINALIDLWVCYSIFKKYSFSIVLSFIAFIAFTGLSLEFNLYRNSKAIALFLLSIPYLKERKIVPYMLLNLGGSLFHASSLLYIPMYFILTLKFSKIFIWSAFVVVNILMFSHISITSKLVELVTSLLGMEQISGKLNDYLFNGEKIGLTFSYLERSFSFILFTLFAPRLVIRNDYNRIFYNCFFVYYILFNLFADVRVFADRIPLLFAFSYWLLYPNVIQVIQRKNNKYIFLIFFFVLCFMEVCRNNRIMTMYDNLLWGILPYEDRLEIFEHYME